ncbi:MAG: phosphoglucosamine mutase [Myxococcota bacterium]
MTRKLFGTDGIRGVANEEPMTAEMSVRIGQAIAAHFTERRRSTSAPHSARILIGKDTRLSGYMFESGLAAGITSMGVDVQLVSVMPTPGISFLTSGMRADGGIVISASHNPFQDNGIKIFGPDGFKLPDEEELRIEAAILSGNMRTARGGRIGRVARIEDAAGRYIVFVKNTFPRDLTLDGLRVVLDCANGAAYKVAPTALRELGAEVFTLGVHPDGTNINQECGSLYPGNAARRVHETRADVGITLDGDADRTILIDENGETIDGDALMAMVALHLKREGQLPNSAMVATSMSNIGLELALKRKGIRLERSAVGDRYVIEKMRQNAIMFGGEKSGHLIFLDHSPTGDGLLAALQVLAIIKRSGKPLSELSKVVTLFPQILVNVPVSEKPPLDTLETFQSAVSQVEEKLGDEGRVVVRYSGTEAKARVMVEGPDAGEVDTLAHELAEVLQKELT